MQAEIEHHRAYNAEFEWKVYSHDRPSGLRERLRARGFEVEPREAVMVLDLRDAHPWIDETPDGPVRRATTPQQSQSHQDDTDRSFGRVSSAEPNPITRELRQALAAGSDQLIAYLAYVDQQPVCAGRLDTHPEGRFAGLYGGSTLNQYRSRGLYRQLVPTRAREARRLGARYLRVDALPTSEPILQRLGFEALSASWPCTWKPGR